MNKCEYCNKQLSSKYYLQTHKKTCKDRIEEDSFKCQYCDKILSSKYFLQTHEKTCKGSFNCQYCDKNLGTNQTLQNHEKTCKNNILKKQKKTRKELEQENEKITSELEKQKLKEQYDKKELLESKIRYEKEINELKKINNEYIQFNNETLKTVVKTNTELSKKTNININGPRIITNTINNNSQPLTVEVAKKILDGVFKYHKENIDNDDFENLITSNVELVNALYMSDDLSKILKLTDPSRNTLKYNIMDEDTNEIKVIKDPKGKLVANYLVDNNIIEFKNMAGSTSVKREFVVNVMNKAPPHNAEHYFPVLDKYGKSIEYFNSMSNKTPSVIEDFGIQLAKKSFCKDHKEMNDQKAVENKDVLMKCQNVIMKLKIYTDVNYQDILVGNTFKVNIWLRAALKELKIMKEWYVSDSLNGTVRERRSEDYILIKDGDVEVKLTNFDVMRMLQIIMKPKLPSGDGIGEYIEKYIKWVHKSFNNLYKNIEEDIKDSIMDLSIEQMKKNIAMYNLDFEKEDLVWINIISG